MLNRENAHIGQTVRKRRGYAFRGTIVALGTKSDGKDFAVVEIEPGKNAAGLLYIHPLDALEEERGVYIPEVIEYQDACEVEFVSRDTAVFGEEMPAGYTVLRDLKTREVIGVRFPLPFGKEERG